MAKRKPAKKKREPKASHRPRKINADLVEIIARAARRGLHEDTIAASAGISKSVFRDWLRRGRRELERVAAGPPQCRVRQDEALYAELSDRVDTAFSEWEQDQVKAIDEVGQGYVVVTTVTKTRTDEDGKTETTITETRKPVRAWQAALELLKRRFPERWDPKPVEPVPEDEPLEIDPIPGVDTDE